MLEAGACAECDVKAATAATKLTDVETSAAPIVILSRTETDAGVELVMEEVAE